jgi:hypothetical protein
MRNGTFANGQTQSFYFPEDHPSMPSWFKGMETIIREHELWPDTGLPKGLLAQCPEFKCPPNRVDCCCRCILYVQPDFVAQKSQLEELITSRGHLCDFYPKYHCELNFIEQYWGVAKSQYRVAPRAKTAREMETTVRESLDSVSLLHIWRSALSFWMFHCSFPHRFANRSARFAAAYKKGLSGAQAAWENKRYHRHRSLPPQSILDAIDTIPT